MRTRVIQVFVLALAGILASFLVRPTGRPSHIIEYQPATSSVAAGAISIPATTSEPAADTYRVTKVIDGDTLAVEMGGKRVTIRLIGLDTPETVDPRKPVQCFGREASAKAKEMLAGQNVRIEEDASQGTYDKYGRTLAYVYLPDLPDSTGKAGGTLFNEYMIAEGYGHEYTYDLPYKYQREFKAAQTQARAQKKGLWADSACGGNTTKPATSTIY